MSSQPSDGTPDLTAARAKKNERAFLIHAAPDVIWRHLRAEISEGQTSERVRIQHEEAPRQIVFWVRMGWGLDVRYDYRIAPQPQQVGRSEGAAPHCEVSVEISPIGIRHAFANVLALGRGSTPYLLAATQGLANLKATAEDDPATEQFSI